MMGSENGGDVENNDVEISAPVSSVSLEDDANGTDLPDPKDTPRIGDSEPAGSGLIGEANAGDSLDRVPGFEKYVLSIRPKLLEKAFDSIPKAVLGGDMRKLKGIFFLDSINHMALEQERFLVVTKDALYRVRYNFKSEKVSRSVVTSLREIKGVIMAKMSLKNPKKKSQFDSIPGKVGVRVFTSLNKQTKYQKYNPVAKKQPFVTLKVHEPTYLYSSASEKHSIENFYNCLKEAVDGYDNLMDTFDPNKCREENEIVIDNGTGAASYMYNMTDSGRDMDRALMMKDEWKGFKSATKSTAGKIKSKISKK